MTMKIRGNVCLQTEHKVDKTSHGTNFTTACCLLFRQAWPILQKRRAVRRRAKDTENGPRPNLIPNEYTSCAVLCVAASSNQQKASDKQFVKRKSLQEAKAVNERLSRNSIRILGIPIYLVVLNYR